jgi:predicted 2-oxoglutarate/Fe(II)-dependent dioxygenase YbiX
MIDLLTLPGFLDEDTARGVRAALERAGGAPSTVLSEEPGGVVRPRVRSSTRVAAPAEVRDEVVRRLAGRKGELEAHFGVALGALEEPQFLRYTEGDFFVAHQDGNTPLIHDASQFRRVSVVLFLSAPSEEPAPSTYGGGALVFHGPYTGPDLRVPVSPAPGTLVAFRPETTHEVLPVTHGERFTVATWFRAADAP